MYQHLTWHGWVLWATEVLLVLVLLIRTQVPAQRTLALYLLTSHAVKLTMIWGSPLLYAQAFYWLMVPEDLLVAVAAVGTCCWSFPRYQKLLVWVGPVAAAMPAFLAIVISGRAVELGPAKLLSVVAVCTSLVLVGFCLMFKSSQQCWMFLGFLGCVLAGTQVHLKLGYTTVGREAAELGWVLGLMLLGWAWVLRGPVADRLRAGTTWASLGSER